MSVSAPKVSIVMPVFNGETFICETLDSVDSQSFTNYELIVVDDGSTDATTEIVLERMCGDDRIRLIELEENSGLASVPRNHGISASRGEYIAFLDSDDVWRKRTLERMVTVLDVHPDVALISGHSWTFQGRKYRVQSLKNLPNPFRFRPTLDRMKKANCIATSSVVVRSDVVREHGGFNESPELKAVEDYEFWLRIAQQYTLAVASEITYFYRVRPDSLSRLGNSTKRLAYIESLHGAQFESPYPTSRSRRWLIRLLELPIVIYFVVVEGEIRRLFGREPRLFLDDRDTIRVNLRSKRS